MCCATADGNQEEKKKGGETLKVLELAARTTDCSLLRQEGNALVHAGILRIQSAILRNLIGQIFATELNNILKCPWPRAIDHGSTLKKKLSLETLFSQWRRWGNDYSRVYEPLSDVCYGDIACFYSVYTLPSPLST